MLLPVNWQSDLICSQKLNTSNNYSTMPWSLRMAKSEIARQPNGYKVNGSKWDYVIGTVLKGFEQVWRASNDSTYYKYIQTTVDAAVNNSGVISGYFATLYTLDNINEGKAINFLYSTTNDVKYKTAAMTLRNQLKTHPRTSEGGFWHKASYPYQMWLDGLYMASPFWTEYGKLFSEPSDYDSVVTQFVLMEKHARDSVTSLLYHGWDEKKVSQWADPMTGCSPSFWGRAIGWYAMALVDALDYFPMDHPGRAQLIAILQRLSVGIKRYQDPAYGTWYQVMDQGGKSDNWREASASCIFVYTIAKAVRLGYIDFSYFEVAKNGYKGILNEFVSMNNDSTINVTNICYSAGLDAAVGKPRNGSYAYYISGTGLPVTNDGKGTGPFMMASVELEMAGYVVPPIGLKALYDGNQNITTLQWKDNAYNAISFFVERKSDRDADFSVMRQIRKGVTTFADTSMVKGVKYYYRLRAKSDALFSDYSNIDSVSVPLLNSVRQDKALLPKFSLAQNYPNPFNPTTTIKFTLARKGNAVLRIFDILGREIATLIHEELEAGISYQVQFDASGYPGGIYFSSLENNGDRQVRKLVLMK
jgi:unsaturated rhamnogalacturonyl hydrolase